MRGRVAGLLEVGAGLHPDLTGRENVFLNASILGLEEGEIRARFDEIVDFADIGPFLDAQVRFYSSGMFLRLAFAVAVHTDPDVFLVDEILAVGDEPFRAQVPRAHPPALGGGPHARHRQPRPRPRRRAVHPGRGAVRRQAGARRRDRGSRLHPAGDLVTWIGAAPAVATALVLLVAPGAAVGWAAGLRGIPAWGAAAPLSVTVLALGAVAADPLGVRWGAAPAAAATLVATLVAWSLGRRLGPRREGDPRWLKTSALSAALLGAGLCAAAVVAGIGAPDRVPQTYDAVFHLNAVQRALETGTASSLGLGTLSSPESHVAFYPGAWHAVTVLVTEAGATPVVAASAVSVALAVLWPFGCLALVRQALGPRAGAGLGWAARRSLRGRPVPAAVLRHGVAQRPRHRAAAVGAGVARWRTGPLAASRRGPASGGRSGGGRAAGARPGPPQRGGHHGGVCRAAHRCRAGMGPLARATGFGVGCCGAAGRSVASSCSGS